MRALIIGCGYVGVPLGRRLAEIGHEVYGLRRAPDAELELRKASITPIRADITRPAELERIPANFDWAINLVSSDRGGVDEYTRTYLEGTRNLIGWLSGSTLSRFIYTSSTSVYGQMDGSVVDEQSPTEPESPTSQILVQTEELLRRAWQERSFPAIVLRVAGIYGPGRGHLLQRFVQGEAQMLGDGSRILNMIHLEDLVEVIATALTKGIPGQVLNAVDDQPVTEREFFQWLATRSNRALPPKMASEDASKRKRGLTSKRLSNARLKEVLGYKFRYPNYQAGYGPEVDRIFGAKK